MAMQIYTPFKEYYNGTAWAPIIESSDKMIQMYNFMVMHLQNRDIPDTEIEAMFMEIISSASSLINVAIFSMLKAADEGPQKMMEFVDVASYVSMSIDSIINGLSVQELKDPFLQSKEALKETVRPVVKKCLEWSDSLMSDQENFDARINFNVESGLLPEGCNNPEDFKKQLEVYKDYWAV